MDSNILGLPVLHHLLNFAQVHGHCINDYIQPSHPLMLSSPSALNLSQHQGLFPMNWLFAPGDQNMGASASASVLPKSIKGFLSDWLVWSLCCPRESQESSLAPQFEGINFLALCLLYGPALTTIHDHWEDHRLDYKNHCQQWCLCFSTHCLGLS